jgi:hypothetical protein
MPSARWQIWHRCCNIGSIVPVTSACSRSSRLRSALHRSRYRRLSERAPSNTKTIAGRNSAVRRESHCLIIARFDDASATTVSRNFDADGEPASRNRAL